jgi:1-acyl-sn-glycerol-3-phosphate acyltransferase
MKDNNQRRLIPKEKIIAVTCNTKKIDFTKKYKFIYFDWWFELLILPFFLLCYALTALCAIYFSLRVTGREHLRIIRKKGCIVIAHHCHYFDTVFANYTLFPRRLYTAVVQRNYEVPVIRRILRYLRAFPIPNNSLGLKMIAKPVGEALKKGYNVLILPEGNLCYMSQEIFQFKPGAFYLSYRHQAPIIPIVYVLTKRIKNGIEKNPHRPRIHQVIGAPMYPPPLNPDGSLPKNELDEMMSKAAQWMEDTIAFYHAEESPRGDACPTGKPAP